MDINEYKKIVIPKIEVGKMIEIVQKVIKDEKDSRLDKYEEQKEVYKPITEKLEKEIDEISNLRKEYVKSVNKPITYIQQQQQQALPDVEPIELEVFDLDADFTPDDKQILSKYNLSIPSQLYLDTIKDVDIMSSILTKIKNLTNQIRLDRLHLSNKKHKTNEDKKNIHQNELEIETLKKYKQRASLFDQGQKAMLQTGKGVYNQTKRHAYKINQTTGQYGNLIIDLPKLFGQLKMIAYKNGKKIYDKNVDFDTLDLFTKRYNGKKDV